MFELKTIQHLYDACTKIEAGLAASRAAARQREKTTKQSAENPASREPSPSRQRSPSPHRSNRTFSFRTEPASPSTSRPTECFRCGRNNHWAKDCVATTKLDGSPCQNQGPISDRRDKTVKFNKTVNLVADDESADEDTDDDQDPNDVTDCRPAGRNYICTVVSPTVQLAVTGGNLIKQKVTCGGADFEAVIDTGAFISTIDAQVARDHDWTPKLTKLRLYHAMGEEMKCVGDLELNVSIQIANTSRTIKNRFVVVENLCTRIILGVDAIRQMNIIIDASKKQPLSFGKQPKHKGVRASDIVLPPRSVNIIYGSLKTESRHVLIKPFGFDPYIHVGHGVCNVTNKTVQVPIINTDLKAVHILNNTQIAGFEPLELETKIPKETQQAQLAIVHIEKPEHKPEPVTVGDKLSEEQINQLRTVLQKNIDAFSFGGELGRSNIHEHHIELLPNAKPFAEPIRRHPKLHSDEANKQVRQMLDKGIVEESCSPWASEYVMVRKKNGEWRMCIDFRRLNSVTKKNSFPLPNIEECLEALAGKKYFSKLDFASGYWQMPVERASRELTAFRTSEGLYQFKMMPFGLTNAPASFQRMINIMFSGLKGLNLQVFLDDVCLASNEWAEHLTLIEKVLQIVQSNNLKLQGAKCAFGQDKICFLGHEVSTSGIAQDPDKLRAFSELPAPRNVNEIRRILGAFGYYRRFVYNFSALADPIINLTRKDRPFQWGDEQKRAFAALKTELLRNATLSHYSATDETMLKTDASKAGLAGMLLQNHDGDWKLVSCVSRRLSDAERNYSITELEGLAIVYSIQKFRPYLLGRPFNIITDHCALCSLGKKLSQNSRLRRWAIVLSEYDFTITYRKGSLHCDVDCLSRAPVCDENDEFLEAILTIDSNLDVPTPRDPDEWKAAYDEEIQKLKDKQDFVVIADLLYYKNKLVVPTKLRTRILSECHNALGHDGVQNTLFRLRHFWWPGIKPDAQHHVAQCKNCQLRKPKRTAPHGTMEPHLAFSPWSVIAFDHVGPWHATVTNKRFICVGIDHYSKFMFARAMTDQSGATFAEFLSDIVGLFGVPQTILTDNSKAFDNAIVKKIENSLGITHNFSAPHHSRGNAIVESVVI